MVTLLLLLYALIAAAVACVLTRRAGAAWLLLALSALWLPANNHVWEGRVLIVLDRAHGLTSSDLIAIAGFVLGAWTLWTIEQSAADRRRRMTAAAGLVGLGLLAAFLAG